MEGRTRGTPDFAQGLAAPPLSTLGRTAAGEQRVQSRGAVGSGQLPLSKAKQTGFEAQRGRWKNGAVREQGVGRMEPATRREQEGYELSHIVGIIKYELVLKGNISASVST
jgi:hypothetical protein